MTEEELEKLLMKPKILHLGKMFHILITNARYKSQRTTGKNDCPVGWKIELEQRLSPI